MAENTSGPHLIETPAEREAREQTQERSRQNSYRKLQVIFNGILAAFTILTAGMVLYQNHVLNLSLIEAKRQADATIDSANAAKGAADTASESLKASIASFRQQVRPYVVNETTRINARPTVGLILGVEAVIRNTGTTPALQMRIKQTFDFQPKLPCMFSSLAKIVKGDPGIEVGAGLQRSTAVFGERSLKRGGGRCYRKRKPFCLLLCRFSVRRHFQAEPYNRSVCILSPPSTRNYKRASKFVSLRLPIPQHS
ncbi:MAG: hypothetical protein EXQ47_01090 [Bryobacterales bacterium]|nr:hypothetical protein [Bryobacterales bacterium]